MNAQFHRDIFACGQNTDYCLKNKLFPNFNLYVMQGNLEACYYILNSCQTKEEKISLLETRYGIQRFSALFFAFLGQRILTPTGPTDYIGVIKLLIEHGARVDAKNFLGKTVIFYATGVLNLLKNSEMVFTMADLCIKKHKELYKDNKENYIPLVDYQDRLGSVALIEGITLNRPDIVSYLVKKHNARLDIKDHLYNLTPLNLSPLNNYLEVGKIFKKSINKNIANEMLSTCSYCEKKSDNKLLLCSRCKVTNYCNKDCQKSHWKEHKIICEDPDKSGFNVSYEKDQFIKYPNSDFVTG